MQEPHSNIRAITLPLLSYRQVTFLMRLCLGSVEKHSIRNKKQYTETNELLTETKQQEYFISLQFCLSGSRNTTDLYTYN